MAASSAKDKCPMTGMPLVMYEEDIILFHTTIKGKTQACLPPATFHQQDLFTDAVPVYFDDSENHWVTKETMHNQILEIEMYCKKIVSTKNLPEDSKMLVLWDVCCCHQDKELKAFMAAHTPNIIVIMSQQT